ncbi:cytochrome c oxidase assembly factor 6 homolog [Protopterus annectens]|uniref:cytochrome c oxidase assembly factor 6 homolog n=1 Tax=Protopterus annectens TaxID=7888 RepID=UPI001CFBF0B0|nr:cytochrome c oxidase assembly factor 6 homolog [Protopterus annectens]
MTAPTAEERKTCWGARDRYWRCLDEHSDDASQCQKFRTHFEQSCPAIWLLSENIVRNHSAIKTQ